MRFLPMIFVCMLSLVTGSAQTQTPRIVWSPDLDWSNCYTEATPFQPTTLYILATGEDFAGAEFRATGLTGSGTELAWTVHPNPVASLSLGDPVTTGCNIAFATCQAASVAPVLLYSIDVIPLGGAAPYYELGIEQHSTPSNVNFSCPLINQCDAPFYTAQCVQDTGLFTLSIGEPIRTPTDPTPADGSVAIPIDTQLAVGNLGHDPGCHAGIRFWLLYFGTDENPPLVADSEFCTPTCYTNPYDPGLLLPETTYYWKLVHCGNDGVCSESDLWSFTTGATVGIEATDWTQVKQTYR